MCHLKKIQIGVYFDFLYFKHVSGTLRNQDNIKRIQEVQTAQHMRSETAQQLFLKVNLFKIIKKPQSSIYFSAIKLAHNCLFYL